MVVLGTLEPRKNVRLVLQFVAQNRQFLRATRFVFIGRWGWGETVTDLVEHYGIETEVAAGRVVFAGFVSDEVKDLLVANARCVVYPSRYEGFGLPIIEALSVGTPVITTLSSSLPEAAGPHAYYFDMDSVDSFSSAISRCLTEHGADPAKAAEAARARRDWAANFTWRRTYTRMRDAAIKLATRTSGERID
jgi:glycosyltransferase involved in cell wall biosynthesis